jgi:hypothetical protein
LGLVRLHLALVVRAGAWRQRPHRSFLIKLLPTAVPAQLLDGLTGNLPAGFLVEF